MYLSRATLSRSPSVAALDALLMPQDAGSRTDAHHRLLWTLFADSAERERDFLWREEREGEFVILSEREPLNSPLFDRIDSKPFAPDLMTGDRLSFVLRANATRSKDKKRVDVVMDALHALPSEDRKKQRMNVAHTEGRAWLERVGERSGFAINASEATDYSVHALPKHDGPRKKQPQFSIIDLTGTLTVTDPNVFVSAVNAGFGRAKAYGCGLMLLRRA